MVRSSFGASEGWLKAQIRTALAFGIAIATGCAPDPPRLPSEWSDLFEVLDTTTVTRDSLFAMFAEWDKALERTQVRTWPRPFRLDISGDTWLWPQTHGDWVADKLMVFPRDVMETPYWPSWARTIGAISGPTVFAAVNLVFRVHVYEGGELVDSVDTQPPSWRPAHRPARGEFAYAPREDVLAYFTQASFVTGMAALSRDILVVAQGRYGDDQTALATCGQEPNGIPAATSCWAHAHHFDTRNRFRPITDRISVHVQGAYVADLPAPGWIFAYGPDTIVLAAGTRGGQHYLLSAYRWRAGGPGSFSVEAEGGYDARALGHGVFTLTAPSPPTPSAREAAPWSAPRRHLR